jgi:hypothetical protein
VTREPAERNLQVERIRIFARIVTLYGATLDAADA